MWRALMLLTYSLHGYSLATIPLHFSYCYNDITGTVFVVSSINTQPF